MRALLIDSLSTGHHITYLQSLIAVADEVAVVVPDDVKISEAETFHANFRVDEKKRYFQWLKSIRNIIKVWKPDIVHFVYGDDLYRYMGIGLRTVCGKCHIVVTFHQIRHSKLRDFGRIIFGKQIDASVVHTEQLKQNFETLGVHNVYHVEYPQFSEAVQIPQGEARKKLGIETAEKVLLALGGTRWDKGLDILLDALTEVKAPFHLLVAGKEQYFSREEIEKRSASYADKVTLILEFLSDAKFSQCLSAADIVVLPYRKSFDGASGPLGEGVWQNKMIIGANHGSLGQIIEDNHLGMTFESENVQSLVQVLNTALTTQFFEDDKYVKYQEKISPKRFQREYRAIYSKLMNY